MNYYFEAFIDWTAKWSGFLPNLCQILTSRFQDIAIVYTAYETQQNKPFPITP